MAIASYKDLCIDTTGGEALGRFYAGVLGLTFAPDGGSGVLNGPTGRHRIWMNTVPEPRTVKNRVHLDVHAGSIAELEQLGAVVLEPQGDRRWTVMADLEGGEFCAFVRDVPPALRLYELAVDAADPRAIASWWSDVFAARLGGDEHRGYWWVDEIDGAPFEAMTFAPVPEPKSAKNRVHWDVSVADLAPLSEAGATLLRPPAPAAGWHVMADPEGNEFCAFVSDD
jgi:hypothetical protein